MLINLWVKDKRDGTIHQVGTDVHDCIEYLDGETDLRIIREATREVKNLKGGFKYGNIRK